MNFLKAFSYLFSSFLQSGAYFKLRFNHGKKSKFIKLLFTAANEPKSLEAPEKVIVVGTGIAALSVLKNIKLKGHDNVTIVSRDQAFGGKCVNYGCMPSEYFSAKKYLPPLEKAKSGREVIEKLRSITEHSFKDLDFMIVQGEVTEVRGKELLLSDGRHLRFDRLILATGNRTPVFAGLGETIPLEKFWELDAKELVIVSDHNVSSLSYASIALDQGMKPTVIFTEKLAVSHLPSFEYFCKWLTRKGIKIVFGAKKIERNGQVLKFEADGKKDELKFDKIIFNGMPNLNLPAIDGKVPNAFDIDLTTCSLINRSDVYLLGDASGLLAASEAEFQARTLVESWKQGQIIDMTQLQKLPFRLHGDPSLAMVGEPWTLLRKDWRMVDFKSLGWSLLHGEEGKLWYLYDSVSNRVEGIHICHQNAADLIALASVLIESPVDDIHWFTSSVHPSSFEIFKVVIEDIAKGKEQPLTRKTGPVLSLPPISQLHQSAFFQNNFSEEERKLAILDSAPQHYLAVLLGIKQIEAGEPREDNALRSHSDGKYRLSSGKPFEYSFVSSSSVYVKMDGKSVTVNFSVGTDDL